MRKIALIYLTLCNGIILLFIGVSAINACYFSALITVMLAYLYVNIMELKRPSNDGSRQKVTNDLKN